MVNNIIITLGMLCFFNSGLSQNLPDGGKINAQFYNNEGLLEFQLDYKPHNMFFPHGHNFTVPGNFQSGHLPQNHIPLIKTPLRFLK